MKEVKTSIDGLKIGMFVSRLDKPWIKTPYELEGVKINCHEDIERLRKYCNYVYVDVEAGTAPAANFWVLKEKSSPAPEVQQTSLHKISVHYEATETESQSVIRNEYTNLRKTSYQRTTSIDKEYVRADKAYKTLGNDFKNLLENLKKGNAIDLSQLSQSITSVVDSVLRNPGAMSLVIKLKQLDNHIYSRAIGTSVWCATFGRHLGLEVPSIEQLALGGLLLDTGKSKIPLELLLKKGEISSSERKLLQAHVDLGLRILASTPVSAMEQRLPIDVMQMIATHHERADGSGYPQSIKNDSIPVFGRIAGIVDSFDAMTSDLPYTENAAKSPHEAIAELYELRGTKFQEELVEQFIQAVGLYPTGSLVELNSGEVAAVIEVNGLRRLRPTIMILLDKNKTPLVEFKYVDLSKVETKLKVVGGLPPGAYGIDMREIFL